MVKRRFIEIFTFTKKERNGIFILILILIIIICFRFVILKQRDIAINTENEEFLAELSRFEESLKLKEIHPEKDYSTKQTTEEWKAPHAPFLFDPNSSDKQELQNLGFTEKQISTIIKYRDKGGKFKNKQDLLKIYGISRNQYNFLEPYIQIKPTENIASYSKKEFEKTIKITFIEINSATESDLVELNGVGESYAKRICKYREILGGFHSKEQLLEVYGMDSTRYNQLKDQFFIDTSLIVKHDINLIKYNDLIKRQYLNKFQVQAILKYRELNGRINNLNELVENKLIPQSVYHKVSPYLIIK
ncbi:MAG: helix-hairpin-helix domain-containing protein [Bacteroidales bacterium]|jgi:competence ComEA-like helix-hairpin-helix protein|nr:helix-hairpin-helix domain-containing protein [Bacteroidales bacterium]